MSIWKLQLRARIRVPYKERIDFSKEHNKLILTSEEETFEKELEEIDTIQGTIENMIYRLLYPDLVIPVFLSVLSLYFYSLKIWLGVFIFWRYFFIPFI